jgi:hypothetical protein
LRLQRLNLAGFFSEGNTLRYTIERYVDVWVIAYAVRIVTREHPNWWPIFSSFRNRFGCFWSSGVRNT